MQWTKIQEKDLGKDFKPLYPIDTRLLFIKETFVDFETKQNVLDVVTRLSGAFGAASNVSPIPIEIYFFINKENNVESIDIRVDHHFFKPDKLYTFEVIQGRMGYILRASGALECYQWVD